MLRSFGISLLLMGLLAASYDGFRERARIRPTAPNSVESTDDGSVHSAEAVLIPPR